MGAKAVFEKYDFIDTSRVAVHGWSGGGTASLIVFFSIQKFFIQELQLPLLQIS